MKKPLVSFVIPCYMFEKYIEQCINSIYDQILNFDFEVIIRDDNSSDNTKNILSSLQKPNLNILDGTKNIGIYENIKTLIESANGKYISYIDGDDFFDNPYKTMLQIDFLEENPNFVMHGTAYKQIYDDGRTNPPEPENVFLFSKDVITTEDMIEDNWGGYGRMFRNIKGIVKPYFKDLPYFDWPLNYELSKYGKIKIDNFFGGYYRLSDNGVFSLISEDEKKIQNEKVRKKLKEDYTDFNSKTILIIDSFISSPMIEQKLSNCIDRFKSKNFDILLISNTIAPKEIINKVDYYFYNHRNLLFKRDYDNIAEIDFWETNDLFTKHEFEKGLQRHGLSVLVNLNMALTISKELGYKYFHRVEVDDLFSDKALEYITSVKDLCKNLNKKALFYYNENNVSFHYFFSEIDFFQKNIESIKSEEDYVNYLRNNGHNNNFLIAEEFIYDNLKKKGDELVLIKNGLTDINIDFEGTNWNTETSESNINPLHKGVTTKIYRFFQKDQEDTNKRIIMTKSFKSGSSTRQILLINDDNALSKMEHQVDCKHCWFYTIVDNNFNKIEVYENDELLYEVKNDNITNYINFLQ